MFERRARGETYSSIARWLNEQGFVTRKGRAFTSFAVKDLLTCRFYLGIVGYKGTEYPGQHRAIIDEGLFEQVQRRRYAAKPPRSAPVTRGVPSGRVCCGRCLRPIWSDRTPSGTPRYREQHGQPCDTGGRSVQAHILDAQVGVFFSSLELPPEMREIAIAEAMRDAGAPDIAALQAQRKRLARAYADGAFSDAEYEARLREIDTKIREGMPADSIAIEEVMRLLDDLPAIWSEASLDEKRNLVAPILEKVYIDLDAKLVAGIRPTPGFRTLLERAVRTVKGAAVELIPPSGWGVVEMGESTPPTVPHSLWLPYPVDPASGAHNIGWLQAA